MCSHGDLQKSMCIVRRYICAPGRQCRSLRDTCDNRQHSSIPAAEVYRCTMLPACGARAAAGLVGVGSFVAACLWLVDGLRKHDKTIWVACIGWVVLDGAVFVGALLRH